MPPLVWVPLGLHFGTAHSSTAQRRACCLFVAPLAPAGRRCHYFLPPVTTPVAAAARSEGMVTETAWWKGPFTEANDSQQTRWEAPAPGLTIGRCPAAALLLSRVPGPQLSPRRWRPPPAPLNLVHSVLCRRPGSLYQDAVGAYASLEPSFWTAYHTFGLVGGLAGLWHAACAASLPARGMPKASPLRRWHLLRCTPAGSPHAASIPCANA